MDHRSLDALLPTAADVSELEGPELDRALWDLEVARRKIEAVIVDVVDRADQTSHHLADSHRTVRAWTMATTNCSPAEARRRVQTANVLRTLDTTRSEFRAGRVGVAQVHELAKLGANPRCADQLPESEQILLDAAKGLEFVDYRTVTGRWQQLADADGAHRDHLTRHDQRNATITETSGEFRLDALLGTIDGTTLRNIFDHFCDAEFRTDWDDAVARHGNAVSPALLQRTTQQRRADALVAIFEAAATAAPAGAIADPLVNLIIDHDTFEQHVREQLDGTPTDINPAEVLERRCETADGIAVDPHEAVTLAFLGKIRRIVIDSADVIVNAGRTRRLFTGPIRQAIMAMQPRCSQLGCTLRAAIAQIDHLHEYSQGGPTDAAYGDIACSHHNRERHRRGYTARRQPDGSWILYRPDGAAMQPPDAEPPAAAA